MAGAVPDWSGALIRIGFFVSFVAAGGTYLKSAAGGVGSVAGPGSDDAIVGCPSKVVRSFGVRIRADEPNNSRRKQELLWRRRRGLVARGVGPSS